MSAKILELNYKPDTFLADITRAKIASENHIAMMRDNPDSIYDDTDFAREYGYQEALALAEYMYKRRRP